MLIKKLVLLNFKPYIDKKTIEFATDEVKNITVIMGDNGAGKTTLAQAFLWVLYGDTEFKIKELLNRVVRDQMKPNEEKIVRVDLHLNHNNQDYIISRYQIYKRESNSVKVKKTEFEISYNNNGQQEFLKSHERDLMIKKMLPQQLSKFFFFDGERIKGLSDEIEKGKSKEFADAVRGLVGLTAIMNALNHLKPSNGANTVIGRYNKKIDEGGNEKIKEIGLKLQKINKDQETIEKRIEELSSSIKFYTNEVSDLKSKIASFAPAEKIQASYNSLKVEISKLEAQKVESIKALLNYFNKNTTPFLSKPLVLNALNDLSNTAKIDKGIPDMHAKTIDFLIKRGLCVCGTKLEPGSDAYTEITRALEFLPPKSIGVLINQFVKESHKNTQFAETYYDTFKGLFKRVREIEEQISESENELLEIDKRLLDVSQVATLKKRQMEYEERISSSERESREKTEHLGSLKTDTTRLAKQRDELILVDERNKELEVYRQYAIAVHDELKEAYSRQEDLTRETLERYINEIFAEIYSDALTISVDDKYNIKVAARGAFSSEELEHSTAQNYSLIFAFIAGIIKMAKEAGKSQKSNEEELTVFSEAEGYPLVMDAPLSAFDKKRIKNICDTLPKIARQVIFFIKDTDGDVAEEHLGNNIGSKYSISIDATCLMAEINVRC